MKDSSHCKVDASDVTLSSDLVAEATLDNRNTVSPHAGAKTL